MKAIKFFGLLTAVVVISAFSYHSIIANVEGYSVGDYATDFNLKNVDGKMVSLAMYKEAKGFLVIFTCNTCPYAVAYEDRIVALDKKFKPQGVPVIAIMPNNPKVKPGDSFENMQKRAKNKAFSFPYLIDEEQKIYPQYGATKTPHVYLLEKTEKGNIVRYIGAIDDNYSDENAVETKFVENAVNEMLSSKPVSIPTTKAIGCSIR